MAATLLAVLACARALESRPERGILEQENFASREIEDEAICKKKD